MILIAYWNELLFQPEGTQAGNDRFPPALQTGFETILAFKLNSLKELCGRLPDDNEAFFIGNEKELHSLYFYRLLDKVCRTG